MFATGRLNLFLSGISKVLDLTGLVECLTHDNLPEDVAGEILELIESTLKSCRL